MAYDPCYHQACDTLANVSLDGLDEMSDAAAHVILLVSKRNFDLNPLVDPLAAVGGQSTGRGGGSSDHASG